MTDTPHAHDGLVSSLIAQLQAMREAERRIFGALDPEVRVRPLREGDWSPKDHQAHLSAWKGRQIERIRSVRMGDPFPTDDRETDAINAVLQKERADWTWDVVVADADDVSNRLAEEIRAAGGATLLASDRLIGGIFGNGPFHALTHFGWLVDAGIGVDPAQVEALVEEEARMLDSADLPDSDRGVGLYNLACAHAVAGRLAKARELLPEALRLRPDLLEFAKTDPDLAALAGDLDAMAGSTA